MSGQNVKASYQDEYSLENFDIKIASYMSPWILDFEEWDNKWAGIKGE
jgi:hypothetical protein